MPGFESIVDQERVVRRLSNIKQKGTIPHALLFTGIEGVGKQETAKVFAMACNCLEERRLPYDSTADSIGPAAGMTQITSPCGKCRTCRKINAERHPDVIFVRPEKGIIKISQVRDLCHMLSMKPYEARQRVVIISEAHAMNLEAGNALLKLLEEPPERTLLILTAPHSRNMLPTIISRCQHVRFKPISEKTLRSLLIDEYGIQTSEAEVLSVLANGSMKKAHSLVKTGWIFQRNWALSVLGDENPNEKGVKDIGLPLALAERMARRKDQIPDIFDIFMAWFRDVMIFPLAPEKIINKDMTGALRQASQQMDASSALSKFETVITAREMIESNANPRLALDLMMTRLTEE